MPHGLRAPQRKATRNTSLAGNVCSAQMNVAAAASAYSNFYRLGKRKRFAYETQVHFEGVHAHG